MVFLFTGKSGQILAPPTRLVYYVITSGHVNVKTTKCDVRENNFYIFISINKISTPFLNWKMAVILFVSVMILIITKILLFNKID